MQVFNRHVSARGLTVFGFETAIGIQRPEIVANKLQKIGIASVRRRFSPEFVNRIDAVLTYQPLSQQALASIVDFQLNDLQQHIIRRLGVTHSA